jgi:CRP/FNR family cyclic AMP-dependent transcriptional regulator
MSHHSNYDWTKQTDFFGRYPLKHYDKGQMIMFAGQEPATAFVVETGVVKAYKITPDGDEKPIAFLVPHDMWPMGWIFNNNPKSNHFFAAFTDCSVYCVPKEDLTARLKEDPELLYYTFERLSRRLMSDLMRIHALEQSRAFEKVGHMFQYLCVQYGRELGDGRVTISLPLTQQDLANLIGLTRETIGIELKKLEQQDILAHKSHIFTVRLNKLQQLLDEDAI